MRMVPATFQKLFRPGAGSLKKSKMMENEKKKPEDENALHQADSNEQSNTQKDPDEWTTGDEPMTGAQKSYLKTLSDEAGVPYVEDLTKAAASKRIDELQQLTGRGLDT